MLLSGTLWTNPFLEVEGNAVLSLHTILHPNDCSEHSKTALHLASALARDYGARLVLLYVKAPQEAVVGEFGTPPPEEEPSDEEYLQKLKQLVTADSRLTAECVVAEGRPVDEILRVARESKCDLIVLGGHAHSWLGRLLAGDVIEQVMHKTKCPVLTVRSPGCDVEDDRIPSSSERVGWTLLSVERPH
jgi:nucleotide-binding universal stress UspA family protein